MVPTRLVRPALLTLAVSCGAAHLGFAQLPSTPAPAVAPAPACAGNAAMSWNVTSIAGADAVRWELRRGSDFPDPDRADRRTESGIGSGATGIVELDLRQYGPILNGEPYFLRIVALDGGTEVAHRSPSVQFAPQQVFDDFLAVAGGGNTIQLSWGGGGQLAGCLDGVMYELKQGTPFSNPTGSEANRLAAELIPQTSGSRSLDVTPFGPGVYYVRMVGKSGGSGPDADVGRRGAGVQVTVGSVTTPTPTPTLTPTSTPTVVVTPTPTFTPTIPQPTATYTPSYTPTTPPAVQTAPPDPNFNNPLVIALDSTASGTEFVSYPQGDTIDRVRFDVTGMNPSPSQSGGRARLTIAASCFGQGLAHIQFFTNGQTFSCGQTLVDREITYDSRTGQVTITAVGGSETYVQWVLTGTAVRLNRQASPGRGGARPPRTRGGS